DVDGMHTRAQKNFQSKIITLNEARAAVGYPARPEGDDLFYAPQTAPAPVNAPEELTIVPPKARKATAERKVSRQTIERRMEKDLARYLAGEYEAAAAAVE
ncbi:MAG TPA: hypothetical protein VNM70_00895, partial [Burkholderiales bacterium]|nr:hypothetical protein [Burkholderiales bacterium]